MTVRMGCEYADYDEILLKIQNPILLNGISFIPDRPDLLERSILIDLPSLTGKWDPKEMLLGEFDKCLPQILGGIYFLLSVALKELPFTTLPQYPRMADFALFIAAAEKGLNWQSGTFLEVLNRNQDELASQSVDENIFCCALLDYLQQHRIFKGTAHDLLNTMNQFVERYDSKYNYAKSHADWPRCPQKVGQVLARVKPYLLRLGVEMEKSRSTDKHSRKLIHLCYEKD